MMLIHPTLSSELPTCYILEYCDIFCEYGDTVDIWIVEIGSALRRGKKR